MKRKFSNFSELKSSSTVEDGVWKLDHAEFAFCLDSGKFLRYIKSKSVHTIDFTESDFTEALSLRDLNLKTYKFVFTGCRFFEKVVFNKSVFRGEILFDKAIFKETASFIETEFYGNTVFTHTEFCGVALFCLTKFGERVKFQDTKFEKNVQFDGAQAEKLVFDNCKASVGFEFKHHDKASDKKVRIDALSFKNTLIGNSTDLDWEADKLYEKLKKGNDPGDEKDADWRDDLIKQLGVFKEVYHGQGDYKSEDSAFRALMSEKKNNYSNKHKRFKAFTYGFFNAVSGYGTSIKRVLITLLISIVLFGCLYLISGAIESKITIDVLVNALHGIVSPISGNDASLAVKIISGVECIWGLFLMALLSAVIVRKIIR